MIDAKEYLEAGLNLHGHKCPAMPLGLRAGMAAMNRLGVERSKDKELAAVVELGDDHCSHCFADGIQTVTGCTFGKGNLRKTGYGKFGVTLVDRKSGQAIRVVPRAEAQARMKETPFFLEYRGKGVPASRVPDSVVDPLPAGDGCPGRGDSDCRKAVSGERETSLRNVRIVCLRPVRGNGCRKVRSHRRGTEGLHPLPGESPGGGMRIPPEGRKDGEFPDGGNALRIQSETGS